VTASQTARRVTASRLQFRRLRSARVLVRRTPADLTCARVAAALAWPGGLFMSSLTGHRRITRRAVQELSRDKSDPLFSNLARANLANHAVMRDLFDVATLGHWLNFGQRHHFMRRFDGQKPYAAYLENVEWIRSNALSAAKRMQERIQSKYVPMA